MTVLKQTRVLVVDDLEKHGQAISTALWRTGLSVLFVKFDEKDLMDGIYGKHTGVRVIFMDINLSPGNMEDTKSAFAKVRASIDSLLQPDNGPWSLITWSSHDDVAPKLFEYLRTKLPPSLRPTSLGRLNKDELLEAGLEALPQLNAELLARLADIRPVDCLIGWESHVRNAAASVVHLLSETAERLSGDVDADAAKMAETMSFMLRELASAEGSGEQNLTTPLYRMLSGLLSDRMDSVAVDIDCTAIKNKIDIDDPVKLSAWKQRIHTMRHLDQYWQDGGAPGVLFDAIETELPDRLENDSSRGKFLRRHFFCLGKEVENQEKRAICSRAKLKLLDITPPCDHAKRAQGKIGWRRFVVVCQVPVEDVEHLWRTDKDNGEKLKDKPNGDHIQLTPAFVDNDGHGFVLAINANLWTSIPDHLVEQKLGEPSGRMREQWMANTMGWLGRHITRQGIVSLPSA